MDFWNGLFQGLVVQKNMVPTSFGWPWSKAKNEKGFNSNPNSKLDTWLF
jgi:hypothetical protein